ncbi:MAG TPA: GNAT family N-acetyltransferase [Erysipelotrichaceae bacterium]|nr:GNAT family N-acetyltransferase [Erysipelotrichaceae bacterium]
MKAIRTILARLRQADNKYNLINHGDKILIGLSGGKDSVALTYALSLYRKFSKTDFIIQPVILDLGFPNLDFAPMRDFCDSLGLKLLVVDNREIYNILQIQQKDKDHLPCSICSRMKKASMNKIAKQLGFNKVSFAHHADDAIETFFMNSLFGGRIASFAPKMHLDRADVTFIRPLINVRESEITKLIKEEKLPVLKSHCPANQQTRREEIKQLLKNLYRQYPLIKDNLLTMLSNYEKEDLWGKEISYQINQEGLTLKPVVTPMDMMYVLDIRNRVFVLEQNVDYSLEVIPEQEKEAHHFLICYKEKPIGTIRYRPTGERIFKIERFAIQKEYRNQHFGKESLNYLTNMLIEKFNPCTIYLDAQYHLLEYYQSLGFVEEGDIFYEANIKHIRVSKIAK